MMPMSVASVDALSRRTGFELLSQSGSALPDPASSSSMFSKTHDSVLAAICARDLRGAGANENDVEIALKNDRAGLDVTGCHNLHASGAQAGPQARDFG